MSAPDCAIDIWSAVRHRGLRKKENRMKQLMWLLVDHFPNAVFFFTAVLTFQSNGACTILFYAEGNTEASFFLSFFFIYITLIAIFSLLRALQRFPQVEDLTKCACSILLFKGILYFSKGLFTLALQTEILS